MVEGAVETELSGCRVLMVAASGVFRGNADVETADIRGTVEGPLTVRKILTVRASARILSEIGFLWRARNRTGATIIARFARFRIIWNRLPPVHAPSVFRDEIRRDGIRDSRIGPGEACPRLPPDGARQLRSRSGRPCRGNQIGGHSAMVDQPALSAVRTTVRRPC